EHVLGLAADRDPNGLGRIVAGLSWSEPVAVWLELGLPLGFEGELDQGLGGPVAHRWDAERSLLGRAGFGDPNPTGGRSFGVGAQVSHERTAPGRLEALYPVHPGGALALVVLRDPANRQASRRPGSHQEPLESVDCLDIAATGGLVDPLLELEH